MFFKTFIPTCLQISTPPPQMIPSMDALPPTLATHFCPALFPEGFSTPLHYLPPTMLSGAQNPSIKTIKSIDSSESKTKGHQGQQEDHLL